MSVRTHEYLKWATSFFNEVNSSITACELPFAGGWIPDQAAAPGLGLLRHAQLCYSAEGVLAQAVAQSTRQVLQVSSSLSSRQWPLDAIGARRLKHNNKEGLRSSKITKQHCAAAVDQ